MYQLRFISTSLGLLSVIFLTGCMHMAIGEDKIIRPDRLTKYQASEVLTQDKINTISTRAKLREETIQVDAHLKLAGLSLDQPDAEVTVLYFGGNLSHADKSIEFLADNLNSCPVNLRTFDYRGYGRTSGDPFPSHLTEDALRIYDHVRNQTRGKLVVHGHSLGSFMAGHIAKNRQIDGLILENTSTTVKDTVDANIPWYLSLFVSLEITPSLQSFDNVSAVSQYNGKALIISAENDRQTPPRLGQKVFNAISSVDKQYLIVPDAGHTELLAREDVRKNYCNFLKKIATH